MRILAIARSTTQHAIAGGMEQQYESLVRGLLEDGHEVSLITTSGLSDATSLPAYSNIWFAAGGNGRYTPYWWFATAKGRERWGAQVWDLIISVSFAGGMASFWRQPAPVIAQVHGTAFAEVQSSSRARTFREILKVPLNFVRVLREKLFLLRFDSVIAISDTVGKQLRAFPYFLSEDAISVVPNGVMPLDAEGIRSRRDAERAARGIDNDEVVFVFVGRLHPQKGLTDAIQAFDNLPNGRLLIAGAGPGEAEAQAAARRNSRISFLGRVPQEELGRIYAAADLLLFSSRRKEGLPMVLLESAASGLPAVAYEGCGVPADLLPGVTLIPADVAALASHMMAVSSRVKIAPLLPDRFSLTSMIERYEDCFDAARLRVK